MSDTDALRETLRQIAWEHRPSTEFQEWPFCRACGRLGPCRTFEAVAHLMPEVREATSPPTPSTPTVAETAPDGTSGTLVSANGR